MCTLRAYDVKHKGLALSNIVINIFIFDNQERTVKGFGLRPLTSLLGLVVNASAIGVGILLVLMAGVLVISLWTDLRGAYMDIPVAVRLEAQAVPAVAPSLGIEAAELRDVRGEGLMKFPPPNRAILAAVALGAMAALALVLWVLLQLRGVVRTLAAGTPFVAANAVRIRRIGYAIILGNLASFGVGHLTSTQMMRHFVAEGLSFDVRPEFNFVALGSGLVILVLAEVFRIGTRLDEDQTMTI